MLKKIIAPAGLIFLIAFVHILALALSMQFISQVTKPMIMPGIALYMAVGLYRHRIRWPFLLLTAINFSWLGDMALMGVNRSESWFTAGLAFFLVAQICYIWLFLKTAGSGWIRNLNFFYGVPYLVLIIYSTVLWMLLRPRLGSMQLPVAIYTIALTLMVFSAMIRYRCTNQKSFWQVLSGAILFLVSDSMIAIDKFIEPIPDRSTGIMVTYILAQWLIATGTLSHLKDQTP